MKPSGLPAIPRRLWVALAFWVVALFLCVALWFLRIGSDLSQLNHSRKRLAKDRQAVETMRSDLAKSVDLERETVVAQSELYAITNAHLLTPLLSSYAMRAKDLLGGPVEESGFSLAEVQERYRTPLPVANWTTELFFMRIGIEINGVGSFAEIGDFIAAAERMLPYASVAGLNISRQRNTPLRHRAVILLEWPAQGPKPLPPPTEKPTRTRKKG